MEKSSPFSSEESDGKLTIYLNPKADRDLAASVLEDPEIARLPFPGKQVLLTGMAPLWMYAHFAIQAAMNGAEGISLQQANKNKTVIWSQGPLLTIGRDGSAWENCFKIKRERAGIVHLDFNKAPSEKGGEWTMEDLVKTPLYFQEKTEVLVIGGNASAWMCAAVAVTASNVGIKRIHYCTPREKQCISIGVLEPGKLVQYSKRIENGIVIGIAGDPNSGKSVFRTWLEKIIKDEWPNSWWIDADPASPTPNWYLDGLNSQQPKEVGRIREEAKKNWTHELELMVANNLRNAREKLDITLVDLPGGIKGPPRQRIPPGREVIFKELDLLILLLKDGDDDIREGWRSALREHNLENIIFAEIESREHKKPPSLATYREGYKVVGTAQGLDRPNTDPSIKPLVKPGATEIIRHIHAYITARHAKAAVAKAFLTGPGGVRYGAAVLCTDGKTYTSGQYSSYNHTTNVHAEKGALLQAAMGGSFAVRVLALASTDNSAMPRPCGVCRQDMLEYIKRTGSAFDVAMIDDEGRIEIEQVSTLLPFSWESHKTRRKQEQSLRHSDPHLLSPPQDRHFRTGDCIQWQGNGTTAIGIVWEGAFLPGKMLTKLKYLKVPSGEWRKLPHSLTEAFDYMEELQKAGFANPTGFGPSACLVKPSDVVGLGSSKIDDDINLPKTFVRLLEDAEIGISRLRCTGSRALGLEQSNSDFDIFLELNTEEILRFRKTARIYLETGKASIPQESGTWRLFDKVFPGGIKRITGEERFLESMEFDGEKVSVIFTSEENPLVYNEGEWEPTGWHAVSGVVMEASCAPYKRACFKLVTDFRKSVEVICYYKLANMVKQGDRLSIGGWLLNNKENESLQRLVQILPGYDPIVWFP